MMERKRKRRKDSEDVDERPNSKRTATEDIDVVTVEQPKQESPAAAVVNGRPHNPFKPKKNSWLPHISNLVLMRCLQKAEEEGVELTSPIPDMDIDWNNWAMSILNPDDVRVIFFYISMELQQGLGDLDDMKRMTQHYNDINIRSLSKADIKEKYKELIPKAPMTAFFQFFTAKREKLVEKHPELQAREVSIKLSEKWKSLSDERKEKYRLKYQMEKETYVQDMEQFYEDYPEAKPSSPVKRKKPRRKPNIKVNTGKVVRKSKDVPVVHNQREPDSEEESRKKRIKELQQLIPKAPTTSYFLFCKAKRTQLATKYPNLPSNDITKRLAEKWQSLGEERKDKYKQVYLKNREEYQQEMALVTAEHPGILEELKELKMQEKKLATAKKKGKVQVSYPDKENGESDEEDEESEENEDIITKHVTKKSRHKT